MVGLMEPGARSRGRSKQVMNKWLKEEKPATPPLLDFIRPSRAARSRAGSTSSRRTTARPRSRAPRSPARAESAEEWRGARAAHVSGRVAAAEAAPAKPTGCRGRRAARRSRPSSRQRRRAGRHAGAVRVRSRCRLMPRPRRSFRSRPSPKKNPPPLRRSPEPLAHRGAVLRFDLADSRCRLNTRGQAHEPTPEPPADRDARQATRPRSCSPPRPSTLSPAAEADAGRDVRGGC